MYYATKNKDKDVYEEYDCFADGKAAYTADSIITIDPNRTFFSRSSGGDMDGYPKNFGNFQSEASYSSSRYNYYYTRRMI